jgi:hypothetical protein
MSDGGLAFHFVPIAWKLPPYAGWFGMRDSSLTKSQPAWNLCLCRAFRAKVRL